MARMCMLAPEAAARVIKRRVRILRAPLDDLRKSDPDAIHDMRVASRRLRAALSEHRDCVCPKAYKAFRADIARITTALGAARELDVAIGMLEELHPAVHGPARFAATFALRQLHARREAEFPNVNLCADIVAVREFDQRLMDLFESIQSRPPCYVRDAAHKLAHRYHALYRLYGLWESVPSSEILHRIRVSFKKMRYACEIYEPLYGPEMGAFLAELKNAQEALGDWNDGRVLHAYLASFAPDAPPKAAEGMPALMGLIDDGVAKHLAGFAASAKTFFAHDHARAILEMFAEPATGCCHSKLPDLQALDYAYDPSARPAAPPENQIDGEPPPDRK